MDGGKQLRWFAEELAGKGRKDAVWPRRWVLGAGSCARSGWGGRQSPARARVGRPRGSLAEQTRRTGGGWPGVRLPAGANAPAAPEELRAFDQQMCPKRQRGWMNAWPGSARRRRRRPGQAASPPCAVVTPPPQRSPRNQWCAVASELSSL